MSGDGLVYEVRRNVYPYLYVTMLTVTAPSASKSYYDTLFTCF